MCGEGIGVGGGWGWGGDGVQNLPKQAVNACSMPWHDFAWLLGGDGGKGEGEGGGGARLQFCLLVCDGGREGQE